MSLPQPPHPQPRDTPYAATHIYRIYKENITTENATSTDKNTPATSLTDKERELIAQMPYEEARDKLIQAVQALETGGLNLDQSMRQWEIGEALAKRAQGLLNDVRAKLDQAQAEQAANEATAGTQSNLD